MIFFLIRGREFFFLSGGNQELCHNGKGTCAHICTNGTIPLLVGDLLLKKSVPNSVVETVFLF